MDRASCPSCGSPILFANKASLATVCDQCRSVVKRKGANLEDYGKIGEIVEDASVLCVGSTGTFRGRRFSVVGRIQLQYLDGVWSEWHLAYSDGDFAWLAEAQGQFCLTEMSGQPAPKEPQGGFRPGHEVIAAGESFVVRNAGKARCISGEGSLPFPVAGGYDLPFVDLVSHGVRCATIDYSEDTPHLFVGEFIDFDHLLMRGLREELPADHPMARVGDADAEQVKCPSCAGPLERKTGVQATVMYCQYCGSGIDLTKEPYKIFAKQSWSGLDGMLLKLGDKGTFEGAEFTVLAMLEREAVQWQVRWHEFLLHHPTKGYRWLVHDDRGHFTWVTPMYEWPQSGTKLKARGHQFTHKETNQIAVRRVAGELYWRVKVGDTVQGSDYVAPPCMLSAEGTDEETTWSFGEYMLPETVWKAFGLTGKAPKPSGVAPHQPAPQDVYLGAMFRRWLLAIALLIVGCIVASATADPKVLSAETYTMRLDGAQAPEGNAKNETALDFNTHWIGPLEVPSGPTSLTIAIDSQVENSWLYFRMGLYDQDRGTSMDFAEEISYYRGNSGGESWSEGEKTTSLVVPAVQAGTYFLRVEPIGGNWTGRDATQYKLTVARGEPLLRWAGLAFFIITVPFGLGVIFKMVFESRRNTDNA
ncbi:MAG: hypothetical protein ACI9WU_001706 [Myxococcota bacterium]|jgi:hypothetical protein